MTKATCSKCKAAAATLTLADNGVLNVNRCTPCAKVDLWGNPGDFVGRLSHMVQYVWPANGASRFDLDDDARRMVEARAGR